MSAFARTIFTAVVLLNAWELRAQSIPTSPDQRAQQLLSATKSGRESAVPCDQLEGAAQALIDLGMTVRSESLERATTALRLGERAARCVGSEPLLGTALTELSEILVDRGAVNEALAAATESVEVYERVNEPSGLALAWNAVGFAHWWKDDVEGALRDYRRGLELATASGNRVAEARVLHNIAHVHRYRGEYESALDHYMRALRIFEDLGERRRAATVIRYVAAVYWFRGEYLTALEHNRRSLEIARALGDQQAVGAALDLMGAIYRVVGAYDLALQSFEQALEVRESVGAKLAVMESTHNLGMAHFVRGDYELAIDAFKRGLRLRRELQVADESFVAEALRNIGAAAWRLGQHERAVANFRESLSRARRDGLRFLQGELLTDLGQAVLEEGRLAESSRLFEESLTARRALGDQAGVSETLVSLARTRLAQHRIDAALELARRALDNAATHDQPDLLWQAQTVAGTALVRLGRQDDAKKELNEAIQSIERLSARVRGGESLRLRFFENKLSPYHELIAVLIEAHEFPEAFELAERSKARVLTRLLGATRDDDTNLLGVDERRERARLRDALHALNQQIEREQEKKTPDQARVSALESSRRSAREAVSAFETVLVARHSELARIQGEVAPVRLPEASGILTDRTTAIVEYVLTNRQLFAFLLTNPGTRATVEARAIGNDVVALAKQVERFRAKIGSRDFGFGDDARSLYQTLLGPFRARLARMTRIIVVPDGVLWNVPFQALLGPDGYVIETAAVSYAPSITVLREIHTLPKAANPRTLFAMAKSRFGSSSLEPLPEAEAQVRLIRDIYGPERSATYVDDDATESRFKASAPRYTVLHLATHGILDEASPLYSHLVLSPGRDNLEDDGRLEAWEIMRMKLAADLVVLAACDTGRGRIAPGEGVIGTMWALFAAGTRSMVVSQFRVELQSATSMLVAFHRRVAAEPGSKTAHLRAAALELLRTARYSHPYYWAAFILVGDFE
jgi:CHAT domain-containing protein/Tfp pilus assembly protein PilF